MNTQYPILLFDGVCNLCSSLVRFIIKKDTGARIKFAPLQSKAGKLLLEQFELKATDLNSVVYIVSGKCLVRSSAVLRVLIELDGGWRGFYLFFIIPEFIRDFFYNFFAKQRYRVFGKKEICMVPTPEIMERFII